MPRSGCRGYRVAVVDIQSDKAANVAQEINAEYGESMAYGFGADATSEQSVLALSRGVDEIFGRVDLLVYSAGIAKAAFISDFQLGDFDRSLQVNLVGYFLCAREFSRLMIRDGIQGRIIQINSKSGKVGSKHNSGYSAAKFGCLTSAATLVSPCFRIYRETLSRFRAPLHR